MNAHLASAIAHRGLPGCALLLALCVPSVSHGQVPVPIDGAPSAVRDLSNDLVRLLRDEHPLVRGEAAIALATLGDERHFDALIEIARDRDEQARVRGLLALGRLGAPGAETLLGDALRHGKTELIRAAAAMALAMLPDDRGALAINALLGRVHGGSYRRHATVLAGLLVGCVQAPDPSRGPALRRLATDRANRDADLRQLAVLALRGLPHGVTDIDVEPMLREDHAAARLSALTILLGDGAAWDDDVRKRVERVAAQDRTAEVRAAALRVLTARRAVSALKFGTRALRSRHAVEVAEGVRAVQSLGGGSIRAAVETRILGSAREELQVAMLDAYRRSESTDFLEACMRLALDASKTEELRLAAGALVARSGDRRVAGALRDLYYGSEDARCVRGAAAALCALDPALLHLDRLFPVTRATDLQRLPDQVGAALAEGHVEAATVLRKALRSDRISADTRADLLRALRRSALRSPSPAALRLLPRELRGLLD